VGSPPPATLALRADRVPCIPMPQISDPNGGGSGGGGDPKTTPCTLVAPKGQYQTARGVNAIFNPTTAQMLSTALANLNQQGIIPAITSGYRSPALQDALASSYSSFVTTPAQVSWHEAGAAVDFGPNSNAGSFPAILATMTQAGFVWGGIFSTPDVPHFQSQPAGASPNAALVNSCAAAAGGQ
jgi:hypothetical protein